MNSKKLIFIFLTASLFLSTALFYNTNGEIFAWGEKEKCVVDPVMENRFTEEEIEKGKIPIGETADEAELFAQKVIDRLEIIYIQGTSEVTEALLEKMEAKSEIDNAWSLIDLTSSGLDNTQDCVDNCPNVPCSCSCSCSSCGECGCCGEDCESPCYTSYCLNCTNCAGTPCPFTDINNTYNQIKNHYDNIETNYNALKDRPQEISNSKNRAIDLIEVKNLLPDDPNRWKILNKLLDSRVKLEQCFTGYGFPIQEGKVKMRTLSCGTALDKIVLGDLMILGYFEDKMNPFPHCYPYNTEEAKPKCEINKDGRCTRDATGECEGGKECQDLIDDLTDNWFCCEGE